MIVMASGFEKKTMLFNFQYKTISCSLVPRLLVGACYPLLAHALNYGMLISVAFYGRGEMMSKDVANRKVCVI